MKAIIPVKPSLFILVMFSASILHAQEDMSFDVEDVVDEDSTKEDSNSMEFDLGDTGQKGLEVDVQAIDPPQLKKAIELYEQKKYDQSAVQLYRIYEGAFGVLPMHQEKAQYFLGLALLGAGYPQSALLEFTAIIEKGSEHPYFEEVLPWIPQLISKLNEVNTIIALLGSYTIEQLDKYHEKKEQQNFEHLAYLMGKERFSRGEFAEAVTLFSKIENKSSPFFARARLLQGTSHLQLRKASPAIRAYRSVLDAISKDQLSEEPEPERIKNLAWLLLGRVYYTAANQTNAKTGEIEVNGRLLGQAVESWHQVKESSEYWLDSLFETSWAFLLADEYARSLGNIHALYSPFFKETYYPEALVLKAVVFFLNCQIENAKVMIGQFHQKYDKVKIQMESFLKEYEDNYKFYQFLIDIREEKASLSDDIRPVIVTALSDRVILRNLMYIEAIEEEEKRLQTENELFINSSLGSYILQNVLISKSFEVDRVGELAKTRYKKFIRDLQDLINQIDAVELEIATYERGQLTQELQEQMTEAAKSKGGEVEVDEEHQIWPFDGEFWRDELGYYRQQVTNQCGR